MLTRSWQKGNTCKLPVEMATDKTLKENNKNRTII